MAKKTKASKPRTDESTLERYQFYRLSSIDLDTARQIATLLMKQTDSEVKCSVVRDLVVTYSRPFSGNSGHHGKHRLPDSWGKVGSPTIHRELVALRNQLVAHSDIRYHAPKVARWGKPPNAIYPMTFKGLPWESLLARSAEILQHVEAVEKEVNAQVAAYQAKFIDGMP